MIECPVDGNVPAGTPDHDAQLALVVEGAGYLGWRTQEWLVLADIGRHGPQGHLRKIARGGEAGLTDVSLEVEGEGPQGIRMIQERPHEDTPGAKIWCAALDG